MKGWYRALVVMTALAAVVCLTAVGYAGYRFLGPDGHLISNEKLIRQIGQWWSEYAK